jgi:ABC-2 type transport system permease protein/oleandomycin transport system permease protein
MARSAVLIGRTLADLLRNVFVVTLMCLVGYLVGWRPTAGVVPVLAGLGLLLFFAYALSWMFAIVGLIVQSAEAAQAAAFPLIAPLVFASSAFVPVNSMPNWLQQFALNQPVSVVVDAVRDLTLGGPTSNDVLGALAWIVGIIGIGAPIAVALYRRVT